MVQVDPETYAIIGAAMRVHATLGNGFLERVYQDALEQEFCWQKIPYEREKALQIHYRGVVLGDSYYADFLCYGSVIVELKALSRVNKVEQAQVLHYLKATQLQRALILNFGTASLQVTRFVSGYIDQFEPEDEGGLQLVESPGCPACASTPLICSKSAQSAVPMTTCEVSRGKN